MKKNKIAPNIIDNSPGRELQKVIKDQLKKSKEAKFAIGYFFLSGFNLVKDDFPENYETLPFLKIVMGNETTYPTKEELVEGYNLREVFKQRMIEDLQKAKLTEEQIKQLEALRDFIANNIIDVKLFDKSRLHAKLYLFFTNPEEKYGSPGLAVVGSSNFTREGLTQNKELNVLLTSREEVLYLNQWFDELWNEAVEFREDLLKVIEYSGILPGSPYPPIGKYVEPQILFKYLVYNWFDGRVLELPEKDILMEFQVVGVVNSLNICDFYNGVILADSVGLGKSFMASKVIEEFINNKYPSWYPNRKKIPSTLLILPPSLIPQWEELLIGIPEIQEKERLLKGEKLKFNSYFLKNNFKRLIVNNSNDYKLYQIYDGDGRNIIGKIAFLSLGKFQNYKVDDKENYISPELLELREEFDLIVVDEAHKYRNKNTNRWKALRTLQKKEDGTNNKFLLLTATPLNNSILDIYNLIRIFNDDNFAPFTIKGIQIQELLRKYVDLKRKYTKTRDDGVKKELKKTASEIKQKILNEIMVLRTRKYILEQFKDLKINGRPLVFKDPKPFAVESDIFYTDRYKEFLKTIQKNLEKISFKHTELYGTRFIVFEEETVGEKEPRKYYITIADLFKLLLGKRLESGIFPFEITLKRIYEREKVFYQIFNSQVEQIIDEFTFSETLKEAMEKAKIEKDIEEALEEYSVDEEEKETNLQRIIRVIVETAKNSDESISTKNNIELLKSGIKIVLKELENDLKLMDEIFEKLDSLKKIKNQGFVEIGKIPREKEDIIDLPIYSYENDPKLKTLKQLIGLPAFRSEKLKDIPSLNGKKIIIFTQYKDTAYYLYHNLLDWIKQEVDLQTWLKEDNRYKIGLVTGETETPTKINFIRRFAPEANKGYEEVKKFGEIHILISTDALSEGVNLQDADAVINYDLPWNPMVIVQRVGRVNRIGNDKDVIVINFIPSNEIEIIVGVLKKLKEKIEDITLVVGKESKILTPEEEITVETFGEKIKDISKRKMTDLEMLGISEDFKEFIPEGISPQQIDEYKLLNLLQFEFNYTAKDFEDIKNMEEAPYYTYISGHNKVISVYEFYRGKYKIDKKIFLIDPDNKKIETASPLVFLDLLKNPKKQAIKIEKAIESLKECKQKIKEISEKLREEYRKEQRGFLNDLYNALISKIETIEKLPERNFVLTTLQNISPYVYSREIKTLLTEKGVLIEEKNRINLTSPEEVIRILSEYFKSKGFTEIETLKIKEKHLGWYYEI